MYGINYTSNKSLADAKEIEEFTKFPPIGKEELMVVTMMENIQSLIWQSILNKLIKKD